MVASGTHGDGRGAETEPGDRDPDYVGEPPSLSLDPYVAPQPLDEQRVWRSDDGLLIEHFRLVQDARTSVADGTLVGLHTASSKPVPIHLHYSIALDSGWKVRQISIDAEDHPPFRLLGDGNGTWTTGLSSPLPEFDGILDVDLSLTPFTTTLPVRRLGLKPSESHDLRVLYIDGTTLETSVMEQSYERLSSSAKASVSSTDHADAPDFSGAIKYANRNASFMATLTVDEIGLVQNYPGLFTRIFPASNEDQA